MVGLLLIAFGTGGIKPCVAAFGGDQFVLPQQERYLSTFFSLFYFSINSGSLISSFLTPLLRNNVSCFGDNTCYSLAFFVPTVLMAVSIGELQETFETAHTLIDEIKVVSSLRLPFSCIRSRGTFVQNSEAHGQRRAERRQMCFCKSRMNQYNFQTRSP